MTERQYVETIRKAAEFYLANARAGDSKISGELWHQTKLNLSPHTAIQLCDAWLTMQEAAE